MGKPASRRFAGLAVAAVLASGGLLASCGSPTPTVGKTFSPSQASAPTVTSPANPVGSNGQNVGLPPASGTDAALQQGGNMPLGQPMTTVTGAAPVMGGVATAGVLPAVAAAPGIAALGLPPAPIAAAAGPLAAGLGAGVPAVPLADGTPLVGNRLIAFVSNRNGNDDIFLYDVITAAYNPLPNANTPLAENNPEISADGRFLIYQTTRAGNSDILLYDILTGSIDTLPVINTPAFEGQPSVSADGRFIAFVSDRFGNLDVLLYDRLTGFLNPLSRFNTPAPETHPDLSASGRFVVAETARLGNLDVQFYDTITGLYDPLPAVNTVAIESLPSVSADGATIAFVSDRYSKVLAKDGIIPADCNLDVFLFDRAFGALDNLPVVNSPFVESDPDLSFDGRFVAFFTNRVGNGDIQMYDRVTNFVDPLIALNSPNAVEFQPSIADVVSFGAIGGLPGLAAGLVL
jgi:Tol biopolymer transport system component